MKTISRLNRIPLDKWNHMILMAMILYNANLLSLSFLALYISSLWYQNSAYKTYNFL